MQSVAQVFATWQTEWPTFLVAAATLVVLSFATFHQLRLVLRQLRHAREEREAAFISMVHTRWNEAAFEEARQAANSYKDGCELRDAIKALEAKNSRYFYVLLRIPAFFEDLGLLCKKDENLIPLVKDLIGPSVKYYYKLYLPWITHTQDDPTEGTYPFFKNLAERM